MIKVAVVGACGKMGREVVKAVMRADDMELVGACDIAPVDDLGIAVDTSFEEMLNRARPDVVVDFAKPFVLQNALTALRSRVVPIIGTTGIGPEELVALEKSADNSGVAAMVIPNFAVGAVLMMKFAAEAARYMPNVEIIELHHDKKIDAPSGTAIRTAEMIDASRKTASVEPDEPAGADGAARGEELHGVHVHSVRLPGLVAHQEVLFGGAGQILTIRHDSIDRTSFMPGVLLAIRKASECRGLIHGLDKLM